MHYQKYTIINVLNMLQLSTFPSAVMLCNPALI